ncbi:hypothetical protein [Shewanella litorisediminis]|uniref:Uncharacterized protein n=1 Tax=Shewanella litorisediminis TaxID=1173586 RepID=A0ABX7G4K9_9GAMM|nr:hypothetical protein [Shewanella litorisediminis]MCL2917802.1 hypothetical protein [Shewanella litorisediminis]QRH02245.1 hypothetical protein JQC75_02115 [Shewanella litorisediminis]
MHKSLFFRGGLLLPLALGLAACGGSDDDDNTEQPTEPAQLKIGGSISGLNGTLGLTLTAGSTQTQSVSGSSFQFANSVTEGTSFSISISNQPDGQVCNITGASGTLNSTTANAAQISCAGVQAGLFLDSPVAGIGYRTETQSGVTDAMGNYKYLPGETVVFFIGDLTFPAVEATGLVTPNDFAKGDAITVSNIARILQTLDEDADPSNGISLSQATTDAFNGTALDIGSTGFADAVAPVLTTLDNRTLVSDADARAHVETSLRQQLIGSWLFKEGDGMRNILAFVDESHYLILHEHTDDGDQQAGSAELGSYEWDPQTGDISLTLIDESDNSGGFFDSGSHDVKSMTLGESLTIQFSEDSITLTRIDDGSSPLAGSWKLWEEADENLTVVVFLSDTDYALVHTNNQESYAESSPRVLSGEFGQYQWSDAGFSVTDITVDADGPGGLYDKDSSTSGDTLTLKPFGEIWFKDAEDGRFSLPKLERFGAMLQDYDSSQPLGQVSLIRASEGFSDADVLLQEFSLDFKLFAGDTGTFHVYFGADGVGTIWEGEEPSLAMNWHINLAGSIEITYTDTAETRFEMVLAPIAGKPNAVLISLTSSESEDSLWQSQMMAGPAN